MTGEDLVVCLYVWMTKVWAVDFCLQQPTQYFKQNFWSLFSLICAPSAAFLTLSPAAGQSFMPRSRCYFYFPFPPTLHNQSGSQFSNISQSNHFSPAPPRAIRCKSPLLLLYIILVAGWLHSLFYYCFQWLVLQRRSQNNQMKVQISDVHPSA